MEPRLNGIWSLACSNRFGANSELASVMEFGFMQLHQYADDIQVYISVTVSNTAAAVYANL